jgi:hypothetical protein
MHAEHTQQAADRPRSWNKGGLVGSLGQSWDTFRQTRCTGLGGHTAVVSELQAQVLQSGIRKSCMARSAT